MEHTYDAIVIGGGLSGLSSAVYLADKGLEIALLESNSFLGGRTSCWEDEGMLLESGFHRYLGFYEEMPQVLKKAGINLDDMLVWTDKIAFRLPADKPDATFGLSILHQPLDTLEGLFGNNDFISLEQKAKLGKFFAKGFEDFKEEPEVLDTFTVDEYAKKANLSQETITRILIPLTEGLFFLPITEYSAYHLFALFAPYLTKLHKTRVGAFKGCMQKSMIEPIEKYLLDKNVKIFKNTHVDKLSMKNDHIQEILADKNTFKANNVVLSVPVSAAQKLLKDVASSPRIMKDFFKLETMPTVCIQIELTEPSMDTDTVVFSPGTILASYTEQSRTTFPDSKGRFSGILSHPEKLKKVSDEGILKKVLEAAETLSINMPERNILDFKINRWEQDFYSYERNMYNKRPSTISGIKNLLLAGDYTKQKYLQTMEGAVYSGRLAAEQIVSNNN